MISYSGSVTQIPLTTAGFGTRKGNATRPTLFEEGPWVFKRDGLYYNVFAAECCTEFIGYSTAPGPTGPWTYRGTIMSTPGQQLHQPSRDHRLQRRLGLLLPQRCVARRWRLHPLGGGREVHVQRRRHHPDDQHDDHGRTAGRHARPVRAAGGRDHRLGLRHRDGGVHRGRDERRLIENGDYIKVKGVAFGIGATSFTARVASADQRRTDRGAAGQRHRHPAAPAP